MKLGAQIKAQIFSVDHICEDKACGCHADEFVQKFRGKFGVEVNMLDREDRPLKKPLVLGPFDNEESAKECIQRLIF